MLQLQLVGSNAQCIVYIEITSWKVRAYGIFTRVAEVSEIEQVSAANKTDFWYFTNECENPVQSAFHAVICLFYTYWDFRNKLCCVKKCFGFRTNQRGKKIFSLWLVEVKSETLFHTAKFDAKSQYVYNKFSLSLSCIFSSFQAFKDLDALMDKVNWFWFLCYMDCPAERKT